jgi:Cupin superfamily protein
VPRRKRLGSRASRSSSTPRHTDNACDLGALHSLIRPTTSTKFLRDIWDKAPALFHQPAGFGHLIAMADLDILVGLEGPRGDSGFLRATRTTDAGSEERPIVGPSGSTSLPALYGAWADGFTVIANGLQRKWPSIAGFCRRLQAELRCPVGANLYGTPAGAQGFAAHFDTHDVFVVQLEGTKTWRVFRPVHELPLVDADARVDPKKLGPPVKLATLITGDVLYIPRGFIHDAVTAQTHSVHLTIGVNQARWVDLVKDLVTLAAGRDVRFRRAVPLDESPIVARRTVFELLSSLNTGDLIDRSFARVQQQPITSGQPVPDGHFLTLSGAKRLRLADVLEHRAAMPCVVTREADTASIRFPGNVVTGPVWIEPALRFVASHPVFAVRELPDALSVEGKCVLATRLIREGFLRFHNRQGAATWQRRNVRQQRAR